MVAKLTRLTHEIALQLHLLTESCTICSFAPGGQSGNFWIHSRIRNVDVNTEAGNKVHVWLYSCIYMLSLQSNFHRKVHTASDEPSRPWSISCSHFVKVLCVTLQFCYGCLQLNENGFLWANFSISGKGKVTRCKTGDTDRVPALVFVLWLKPGGLTSLCGPLRCLVAKSNRDFTSLVPFFPNPFLQCCYYLNVELLVHRLMWWYIFNHDDSSDVEEDRRHGFDSSFQH
jgi:hypothetical protein